MRKNVALFCLWGLLPSSLAFVGLGLEMYDPSCAFACKQTIQYASISCSSGQGHRLRDTVDGAATPGCRAGDDDFLTTLAWCLNEKCPPFSVEEWRLEKFWAEEVTGDPTMTPKWTYGETLQQVETTPEVEWQQGQILNFTAIVPEDMWDIQRRSMEDSRRQEGLHAVYGYVSLSELGQEHD